jgi:hypothetical protein
MNIMAKGRGYYNDDEYSDDEMYEMQVHAMERNRQQDYSIIESVQLSTEYVERKTGFGLTPEDVATLLEQARRTDPMSDIRARSNPSGRPRKTASYRGYDDYDDDQRRPRRSATWAQPISGTEYNRLFQIAPDKFASRTSGKILTKDEIVACAQAMVNDLLTEGKSLRYAEHKVDQFVVRDFGKQVAALQKQGYRFREDEDDNELDVAPPRTARQGAGRKHREPKYDDKYDDYGAQRTRSGYGNRRAEPEEIYNTSHPYTDDGLETIRKKIYTEWNDKGCSHEEAELEAEKWYLRAKKNRRDGGKPLRGSGFDKFSNMRDAPDDEDDYPRQKPRTSRDSRSGTTGNDSHGYRTEERRLPSWDGPQFNKYFTEEPDDYRPGWSTGSGSRGYRTEERRPGGSYSSGSCGSYNEPGGVKPAVELYKLLGVSKKATISEITKAWKKLCLQCHPDRTNGTAAKHKATDKMAQINDAKDVLADADLRDYYDHTGLIASMGESPDA